MLGLLKRIFGTAQDRLLRKYSRIIRQVNEWEKKFQDLSDTQLKEKTAEFRRRIEEGASLEDLLPEAYAVVKNACRRQCGTDVHVSGYDQKWDMIPYDVQILGAIGMHKGAIAEMQTGEGKTLTAVMPLYLNALTGKAVHLVTVNDYLAERDCQWVGSILKWLGLSVGALTNNVSMHERKEIYQRDVVYGTASEFGFDYLRDNSMAQSLDEQVQRGHFFAIVDEIDSILIDEARTPLIISGPVPESRQMYAELKEGVANLVRVQRDLTNRLATEARKVLEKHDLLGDRTERQLASLDKEAEKEVQEALRKLWLVGKGTPRNRILKRVLEDPDLRASIDKWDLYYYSEPNKAEKAEALAYLFITVDEKAREYELTDKGISAWASQEKGEGSPDDFVMLDLSAEYIKVDEDTTLDAQQKMKRKLELQEEDAKRKERAHNIRQLLHAHLLMERDVEYIVAENKIVIIDENTGRPQPGRRFSDGLHQAIEAKEGVAIQQESQTYATITLQNYFRMYKKLAGMTGTAATEAHEFKEIYRLEVLEIPTHRPCIRTDAHDEIYMTEREKYAAILKEIQDVHQKGRPILIGTESVEISEKLSRICRQNHLPHVVLNAKNHAREAEIIAQAGQRGAITVATNMAGRGTDIKLGASIAETGGLHVIGTTRHQSRRIDRQLRGRCARQGDPGSSKFYVCFEDSLLRLFASPTLTSMLQRFRPEEGEPISAGILNRSIQTAQKRVEQRNYMMRKHTLEYDDVMNKQRQEIYAFRNELLSTSDVTPMAQEVLETLCEEEAHRFFQSRTTEDGWDPDGFRAWLQQHFPVSFPEDAFDDEYSEPQEFASQASQKVVAAFLEKIDMENRVATLEGFALNGQGEKPACEAVRRLMIHRLDQLWQEHLLAMDHLRSEVHLRSHAQKDPLMEFKQEAFILFDELGNQIRKEIAQGLFKFRVFRLEEGILQRVLSQMNMETDRSFMDDFEPQKASVVHQEGGRPESVQTMVSTLPRIGRNDPCPCGSGKKYKKCCGQSLEEAD